MPRLISYEKKGKLFNLNCDLIRKSNSQYLTLKDDEIIQSTIYFPFVNVSIKQSENSPCHKQTEKVFYFGAKK